MKITIPGDAWLLNAEFIRQGHSLILRGQDGKEIFLQDYFISEPPADLITDTGAIITGPLALKLAGPLAPAQFAGPTSGQESIGRVDAIEGKVEIIRTNGIRIEAEQNTDVFQGDVIVTGDDASVGISFVDDTIFSLGDGGRMVIDEMIYDPDDQEGKFSANIVQGMFTFVSGQIAKSGPDAMTLSTPVATIGIRGTKVAGVAAQEGSENTLSLLPEMVNGQQVVGEVAVSNSAGSSVLNTVGATLSVTSSFQAPPPPVRLSEAQIQQKFSGALTTLSKANTTNAEVKTEKATQEAEEAKQEAEVVKEKAAEAEAAAEEAAQEADAKQEEAEAALEEAQETGDQEAIEEAEQKIAEAEEAKVEAEQIAQEAEAVKQEAQEKMAEVEAKVEAVEEAKQVLEVAKQELVQQIQVMEQIQQNAPDAPEEDGPQEEGPADDAPQEENDAPAEEGGGEEAPQEAPLEEGPLEEAPLEEGPLEEGPLEEGPLEEGPPIEEGKVEEGPPIEKGPEEGEGPIEEAPKEEAVKEEPQVFEEAKPEVVEAGPIEQAPQPVVEAPKPEVVAPPPIVFIAPVAEPVLVIQNVVEHYHEPEPVIEYFVPEVVEAPKFAMMARAMAAPILVIEPIIEEVIEEEVEEETVEPQPNLLEVGSTGTTIAAAMNIGYYSMSNGQGVSKQVAPIEDAGHNAVKMTTLSETELASVDILWAINPSNSSHGNEFKNAIDRIKERVDEGMILVIHDRQVGNAENILFGEEPADIVRKFTNSRKIDVIDETTVVGEGPGGFLTDNSIDGGNSSNHGYTKKDTLPDDSLALLNTSDEDEIVDFAYKYGEGAVIYSSIPLDYYLGGTMPNFKDIYAPNILQFAASLITDGYNTIEGTNSNEIIAGTANNDTLKGLDGNDTIFGLYGNDKIEGGEGADTITGGSGSDIYIYRSKADSPAGSGDIIKDYQQDEQFDISDITSAFNIVPSFTGSNTPEVTFNSNTKLLQLDLDSDSVADMEVTLENFTGSFEEGTYENGVLA